MKLISMAEAVRLSGKSRSQLQTMLSRGELTCIRSGDLPSAPIFFDVEALRTAGVDIPPDTGEDTLETIINAEIKDVLSEMWQRIESQGRVIEELKGQVRALNRLHAHHPLNPHTLPPQAS